MVTFYKISFQNDPLMTCYTFMFTLLLWAARVVCRLALATAVWALNASFVIL